MSELPMMQQNDAAGSTVCERFIDFLQSYRGEAGLVDSGHHVKLMNDYQAQITWMIQSGKSTVFIDFGHILKADHELAEAIELEYYRFEPYLRHAVQQMVANENQHYVYDVDKGKREFFVSFYNFPKIDRIRAMGSEKVGRLMSISGTVTRSSEVKPELLIGSFVCRECGHSHPFVEQQFQYTTPQRCTKADCSGTNFQLVMDQSAFVDWQRLRVQENADEIPAGSMPRCIDVICRNEVVEIAKAGDKIVITGYVAVVPDSSGLARAGESTMASSAAAAGGRGRAGRADYFGDGVSGLKKLGVREMTYRTIFLACSVQHTDQRTGSSAASSVIPLAPTLSAGEVDGFGHAADPHDGMPDFQLTDAEKLEIIHMRNTQNLYHNMVVSMCPSVFGHLEVKRGILLMLFGGVHKTTSEGISLRGDLNVCLVGDPSCAKSQFLKYVHGFLPRTVYTSGKSASAAGLTASVARDPDTGDFSVEAGALMLADNGICCIDEFDKMDQNDQVAIHEAMEQQTISITKAGIQATLNARTSILAAANPVFGRYDRTKTLKANVAVSAAIMSRFDLFFVILDECNPRSDEEIARHIVSAHKAGGIQQLSKQVPFSREQIQRYVQFSRLLNPIITQASRRVLVDCYRLLRQNDMLGKNKTAYRITVRQLESLVRLSEALARLHLDEEVQPVYVREAYRLLQKSIIFVESEDIELEDNEEEMENLPNSANFKEALERAGIEEAQGDTLDSHAGGGKRKRELEGLDEGERSSSSGSGSGLDSPATRTAAEEHKEGSESAVHTAAVVEAGAGAGARVGGLGESSDRTGVADTTAGQQFGSTSRVTPVAGSAATRAGGAGTERKEEEEEGRKRRKKTQISAKEYEEITQLLILRLKHLEEHGAGAIHTSSSSASSAAAASPSTGAGAAAGSTGMADAAAPVSEEYEGCLWGDLVQWYLEQFKDTFDSVDALEQRKKVIGQVIRRMLKYDGSIIEVEDPTAGAAGAAGAEQEKKSVSNEKKLLRLHPSYAI